jgi:ABC-type uncharacterized transport system involved in gliding motility auxiliary subunit
MERKVRARSESFAFVGMVLASLVLFNLISVRAFGRIDLTKRQLFTLSDGTKRIVRGLQDQLTITVYFTPNQPPPANDDERFLRDQLDEYRSISNGRIKVVYVSPDNEERRRQADSAGCEKAPLQAVDQRQEQATIQEVYRCVAFEYRGSREKIAFLPPGVQGLEYELSSIIKNLSMPQAERERTIGFLSGHGELTPDEGLQYLPQLLEQARLSYRTRTVNLNGGENDVPSDIKGLVIMNPNQRISERELRKLDAYLMRGGAIAIFAGGVNFPATDPANASGTEAEHHLNDWLEGYGLKLQSNDLRSTDAVVQFGRYRGRVRLVTWPEIASFTGGTPTAEDLRTQGGVDPSFPVTFRLPGFVTTYPSEIRIDEGRRGTVGGTLKVFASTGPRSILRTNFNIDIREILQQGPGQFTNAAQHGPYPVGVALEGEFRSAFAGRPESASDGGSGDASAAPLPSSSNVPERANSRARLMVISSGNMFALDTLRTLVQISGGQSPNLQLIPNTFDWLSQDLDLLAVRAKDTSDPQIRADVSDKAKQFFKWGSIALLPAAIGILGFAVLSARRSRIKELAKEYGAKG